MTHLIMSAAHLDAVEAYLRERGWTKTRSGNGHYWWHERTGSDRYTNLEALDIAMQWERDPGEAGRA